MRALSGLAAACRADGANPCAGRLEIRLFALPGWNRTGAGPRDYPAYSRVNHQKYVVTDARANVGTSNMAWGYFYQTAGTSFNTDDAELRGALAEIFDRNWRSAYATPLEDVES